MIGEDVIQNDMFRILFNTPRTTPLNALWWDLGTLPIESKIISRKLNLFHHIWNLDDQDVAKKIMREQIKMQLPGLATEVLEYMKELELPDITNNKLNVSSITWKNWSKSNKSTL